MAKKGKTTRTGRRLELQLRGDTRAVDGMHVFSGYAGPVNLGTFVARTKAAAMRQLRAAARKQLGA